jgi:hypothetical protein
MRLPMPTFRRPAGAAATCWLALRPAFGAAEDGDPVEAGREALDGWWGYPWYDKAADDFRPLDLRPPTQYDWQLADLSGLEVFAWAAILTLLALLIVWLVYLLVRTDPVKHAARPASGNRPDNRVESLPFPLECPVGDLLAEARRRYEQGDYAGAMIYLYSHVLVQLDRQHVIRLARGKTNRQYLRETAAQPDVRTMLEPLMLSFEDVFFGRRPLDRARFESCWRQLDRLGELFPSTAT